MAFKSSGKILSSWRRYVCISYASRSGSGKIHNCMLFLVNALRKEGQGPIIRCGLEQTINSLIALSFFRQELRRRPSLPRSLKLLEAMFEFDQISWCRSLNGVVLPRALQFSKLPRRDGHFLRSAVLRLSLVLQTGPW